jgi:hypothetical protein
MSLEDLKAVSRRAMTVDVPGVVLVCASVQKCEIIEAALPLINHLIITTDVAEVLALNLPPAN